VGEKVTRSRWISLGTLLFFLLAVVFILSMPRISELKANPPRKTAFMEHQEQEWRKEGKTLRIQQIWVPLAQVSPYLTKAVIIAEDDKFWTHEGFDVEAIQKAIEKDLKARRFKFGGSTISQQLTRNLFLSPDKTLLRKLREALITWRMERVLSKRRILELYLNVVEWGEGIFGIEAASRFYFGKPARDLNPEESARLAAVLPNPKKYRPTGNQPYVMNRTKVIYNIMVKRGIVIPEYDEVEETEGELPPAEEVPQATTGEEESESEK
jgi:monofunctional biosynthetic peptidoglycan transglycosylase